MPSTTVWMLWKADVYKRKDPGKDGVALGDVHHAADAQHRSVGHHAQQDDTGKLHLLDIVGGAGDERGGANNSFFNAWDMR